MWKDGNQQLETVVIVGKNVILLSFTFGIPW